MHCLATNVFLNCGACTLGPIGFKRSIRQGLMFDRSQREHTVLGIIKQMQPLVRTRFKLDECAGGTCRSPRAYEGNKYFTYSHTHDNRDSNFGGRDRETGHATWPFVL